MPNYQDLSSLPAEDFRLGKPKKRAEPMKEERKAETRRAKEARRDFTDIDHRYVTTSYCLAARVTEADCRQVKLSEEPRPPVAPVADAEGWIAWSEHDPVPNIKGMMQVKLADGWVSSPKQRQAYFMESLFFGWVEPVIAYRVI